MSSANTNEVLNRLYVIHHRSLPTYLSYAAPFAVAGDGDDEAARTLKLIAADQRHMADRIGELIVEGDGNLSPGGFPMFFTGWHDLSFDFLVQKMIERQRLDLAQIKDCVVQLSLNPMAQALAEEALGLAEGHLENLLDLTREKTGHSA